MLKDILVAATGSAADETRFRVAETLAERHGAAMTVVTAVPMRVEAPPPAIVPGFGASALATPMPDLTPADAADDVQVATEGRFADRTDVRLIRVDDTAAGIEDRIVTLCRTKDLFITSGPQGGDGLLPSLHEAVLADGAGPVLVLPADADPVPMFRRVCIAWNGSAECAQALHHAMPIIALADDVSVVMVDQVRAAGEDVVARTEIERHLEAHGVTARLLPVVSGDLPVAAAIIAEAERVEADLLVAGSHDRSGFLDWLRSSVSRDLVRKGRLPLLLAR